MTRFKIIHFCAKIWSKFHMFSNIHTYVCLHVCKCKHYVCTCKYWFVGGRMYARDSVCKFGCMDVFMCMFGCIIVLMWMFL